MESLLLFLWLWLRNRSGKCFDVHGCNVFDDLLFPGSEQISACDLMRLLPPEVLARMNDLTEVTLLMLVDDRCVTTMSNSLLFMLDYHWLSLFKWSLVVNGDR